MLESEVLLEVWRIKVHCLYLNIFDGRRIHLHLSEFLEVPGDCWSWSPAAMLVLIYEANQPISAHLGCDHQPPAVFAFQHSSRN